MFLQHQPHKQLAVDNSIKNNPLRKDSVGIRTGLRHLPRLWAFSMCSEKQAIQCRVVLVLDGIEGWGFDATDD